MKQFFGQAPDVRLAPKTDLDAMIVTLSRLATIGVGVVAWVFVLHSGEAVLAPVTLAVIIGLMFGPLADRIETAGIPPWLSAAAIVFLFVGLILATLTGFAVPLSDWIQRLPRIWTRLQQELAGWQGTFKSVERLQEQFQQVMGASGKVKVTVDDGASVEDVAYLAPGIAAQIVVFLASLYFFIATRAQIRIAILSLFIKRRLRWRLARTFRDVEFLISRYLLSITAINAGLAMAVSLALWLLGTPSPLVWGLLAGVLNYVIYVGPAAMAVILFGVGLAVGANTFEIFLPAVCYLSINLVEAQFVTPHVIGRTVTLNPFLIFLAVVFWIWVWGPIGGFIAVPSTLILAAVIRNVLPAPEGLPGRYGSRDRRLVATPASERPEVPS